MSSNYDRNYERISDAELNEQIRALKYGRDFHLIPEAAEQSPTYRQMDRLYRVLLELRERRDGDAPKKMTFVVDPNCPNDRVYLMSMEYLGHRFNGPGECVGHGGRCGARLVEVSGPTEPPHETE